MTDLICKNSGYRCQTPGMCAPHGGCRETEPVSSVWLAQLRSEFRSVAIERDQLKADVARSTEREILQLAEIESLRKVLKRIKFRCESFSDQGVGMQKDSVRVMLHIAARALGKEAE